MSILTNLPVTLTCGTPATVTLDADQLITDFGIVDPYWSNSANWRQCKFVYGSDQASQKTKINFTITTGLLNLTTNAYDGGWECSGIFITDGLENQIVFQRSQFPISTEFDFDSIGGYSPLPPPSFIWDTFYTEIASTGSGELHRTGSTPEWQAIATNSTPFSGDFEWTGSFITVNVATENMMIGYKKSLSGIPNSDPAVECSSTLYVDGGVSTIRHYSGNTNTASTIANIPDVAGLYYFTIRRVGSAITAKVNGTTIFTDSYSGDLYPVGIITYNVGSRILSCYTGDAFSRDFITPAVQQAFELSATPFGTIQYAVSGLRLVQAGLQPSNYQIYYTSTLSDYFPNLAQNYSVTVSYEVLSIDAAFVFLKVLLGDVTITMNSGDPRLSVGVHNNEVFTFNTCNVQAGGNSFQFWMNAQDNTEIKFFDYVIQQV